LTWASLSKVPWWNRHRWTKSAAAALWKTAFSNGPAPTRKPAANSAGSRRTPRELATPQGHPVAALALARQSNQTQRTRQCRHPRHPCRLCPSRRRLYVLRLARSWDDPLAQGVRPDPHVHLGRPGDCLSVFLDHRLARRATALRIALLG